MSELSTVSSSLSEQDKQFIESLLTKVDTVRQQDERIAILSRDDLPKFLNQPEIRIIDRVFAIDPTIYGFKGQKQDLEPVPEDLVRVEPQPYAYKG